jgi:hypothetical protein
MSVDVTTSPTFKASVPQPLFSLPQTYVLQPGAADMSSDASRFLLGVPLSAGRAPLHVIMNWR